MRFKKAFIFLISFIICSSFFIYREYANYNDIGIGVFALIEYKDGHTECLTKEPSSFTEHMFQKVGLISGTNWYVDSQEVYKICIYGYLRMSPPSTQFIEWEYWYHAEVDLNETKCFDVVYTAGNSYEDWMDNTGHYRIGEFYSPYWDVYTDAQSPSGIGEALKLLDNGYLEYSTDGDYFYIGLQFNIDVSSYGVEDMDLYPIVIGAGFPNITSLLISKGGYTEYGQTRNMDVDFQVLVVDDQSNEKYVTDSVTIVLEYNEAV